jgi:uncharacterized protein YndB with AHSA1/START domain
MSSERTVAITRLFDAPRERVFAAWTQAKHLAGWFGPKGFSVPACEVDARPGGAFRLCVRSPEGKDYWVRGEYREVLAPERLVIACTADDENGVPRLEERIEVNFTEQRGRTEVRLLATARGASPEAAPMLEGMPAVWAQTFTRLGTHLKPDS